MCRCTYPPQKKQTQEPSEEREEAPKAAHPMPSRVFLPKIQPGITGQHDLYLHKLYNTYLGVNVETSDFPYVFFRLWESNGI